MLTDLARTPIAETLRRLSAERRSGDLQVRSGKVAKTIFFDHGRVVFAASNLKKDRLGEALIALGRITDDDFNRASALMKGDRKRRFGEALVQSGVMDKYELGRSVARQVKRIVLSLFSLTEGAASFEDRKCAIPLEYMVSLSVHRLLYVGIKSMTSEELVLAGLGKLDRRVTLAEVAPFPFGIRKCSAEEKEILEQCRSSVTLRRLAWAAGGLSLPRLRAAYGLLASGVLRSADVPEETEGPQPIVQMETTTFLLSALRTKPDPTSHEAIRLEVDEELARSERLDRETWLKVSRTAPRAELIRALEEKMERYHALLEAVGDSAQAKTDIEVILGRASAMLRLAKKAAATEGTPAPAPAAAPASPAPRAEARAAQPATPAAAVAPGASNFAGSAQVEHLLMEGEVRMTVSDYANAVKVFTKLVDIAPKVPAYRVKLALAMACYPRTAKQAEREFLDAIILDPNNADIHYQFGLYYKAMRQRTRALAELRTAVRLNRHHKLARQELEALSPKDSALTSLKKLFR
jgi:Domain of unknown function (DUF4388)